jgi:hypothetical protein
MSASLNRLSPAKVSRGYHQQIPAKDETRQLKGNIGKCNGGGRIAARGRGGGGSSM